MYTYSFNITIAAKCRVDDLRAHYKNTINVAISIKGMKIKKAIKYMEDVLEHKRCIPYFAHTGHAGRTP